MPQYKVGERLRGRVSKVEVVVVRAPGTEVDIACAGVPVARDGEERGTETVDDGSVKIEIGKRYEDQESGLEVLCVVAGVGPLAVGGRALVIKSAKPLPASD